jgi:hypothetical protein
MDKLSSSLVLIGGFEAVKIKSIFDVFSGRNKASETDLTFEIPNTFRNKLFLLCRDVFSNSRNWHGGDDYSLQFWEEIHQALQYRHGRPKLVEGNYSNSRAEDVVGFLHTCDHEEFLDFIEYIFKVKCLFHIGLDENEIVEEINDLFKSENLGYELTEMVKEKAVERADVFPFGDREFSTIKIIAYPMVIRKDQEFTYSNIQKPALKLLANPRFKSANQEFLEALEDYRTGDFGNCLVKCGSAFESVMKIICNDNGWPYTQNDTAATLIKTVIDNTNLDSYFEQPLTLVATLRNKLSKAHGAGTRPKNVPQHLAKYSLNATASAIILLVDEAK